MLASRLRPTLLLTAATAVFLTGCTVGPVETSPTTPPSSAPSSAAPTVTATPSPSATPTGAPDAAAEPPTRETISCDTMLDPAVDADLRARGLVPAPKQDEPFGMNFEGAHISCPWGYEGAMTPEEMYTYTQLTADERVQFLAAAAENGYVTEDDAAGTWLTWQSPDGSAGPDDWGVWLVADEWTVTAPSRDAVQDIVWVR